MYEQQREHTRGARFNLETQLMTIENSSMNVETMKAMKAGSSMMKNIHGEMNVDRVDATMDDIREQMDLANEINQAISTPLGGGMEMTDDEELEAELEQLEQTELDRVMLNIGPTQTSTTTSPVFANVPTTLLSTTKVATEEDELEELRASMAL